MSSSPHDALFKAVFGEAEHARGELRAAVPAALAEALDWATLARCPGSFVDPALRERHTDLLFSVAWRRGGDALVYVLFEHQSTVDDHMAYRLLRYQVRIWERWLAEHPGARGLPVVVPLVMYHGATAWSAPRSFDALLHVPDEVRPTLEPYLVRFAYLINDLSEISDQDLRQRATTALAKLAALCFKHARTRADFLEILAGWADVLRQVRDAAHGLEALERVMSYILQVSKHVEIAELQALLERDVGPESKAIIMTTGQQLIQQGEQKGFQKGVQQGQTGFLLRLLRLRFGSEVNADTERRLATASSEQLEIWVERVLTATTLSELLAD